MWVSGHSRSLKSVPFERLGAVSYSPSIVTMAVSVTVCEIFSVKEWRDLENQVRGRSRLWRSQMGGLGVQPPIRIEAVVFTAVKLLLLNIITFL